MAEEKHRSYSSLGNIALVNFGEDVKLSEKKKFAEYILSTNKSVKTVLEKSKNFFGRLRTIKTNYLAGEKNKEVLYKENGCEFRFHIEESYFSPRLSNERKEVAELVKKGDKVLVCFAGVGPFSIVIAKNSSAKIVYSNELNRKANEYAKLNIERNKVKDKVILVPGDIKKVAEKLKENKKKFDLIVMPRPNLKDSFLSSAFSLSKSGTRIIYYGFGKIDEIDLHVDLIKSEAKKAKKKIKILGKKIAGEIAPFKARSRIYFKVL